MPGKRRSRTCPQSRLRNHEITVVRAIARFKRTCAKVQYERIAQKYNFLPAPFIYASTSTHSPYQSPPQLYTSYQADNTALSQVSPPDPSVSVQGLPSHLHLQQHHSRPPQANPNTPLSAHTAVQQHRRPCTLGTPDTPGYRTAQGVPSRDAPNLISFLAGWRRGTISGR